MTRERSGGDLPNIGAELSDQKIRGAKIADYVIPLPIQEFEIQPTPLGHKRHQPRALLLATIPFVNLDNIYANSVMAAREVADNCELVLMNDTVTGDVGLAVQLVTRTATAREYIRPDGQEKLLGQIHDQFPGEYRRIIGDIRVNDSQPPVITKNMTRFPWSEVSYMGRMNEAYDLLGQVIDQSPSQQIRVEVHESHQADMNRRDADGHLIYKDQLVSSIYNCSMVDFGENRQAIKVDAKLPLFTLTSTDITPSNYFDLTFYMAEGGVAITSDDMATILAEFRERNMYPDAYSAVHSASIEKERAVREEIRKHWNQVCGPLTHVVGQRLRRKDGVTTQEFRRPKRYSVKGFRQELMRSGYGSKELSIRIFDAGDTTPTVRDEEEVNRKLYMTVQQVEEDRISTAKFKELWVNEILPSCRSWSEEGIKEAANDLRTNRRDPVELVRDRLAAGNRLVIIGTKVHPLYDALPQRILNELPIDFVAIEAREPGDSHRMLQEEEMLGIVKVGDVTIEMSHEEAKKKFPDNYQDPNKPIHTWDSLIGKARNEGLDIVYTLSGNNWKDLNAGISTRIAAYLEQHPDARGVYFATLLHALAWPGYKTKKEGGKIGFIKPFHNDYSFAKFYLSDSRVRMPAYELKRLFPDQVYTAAQMTMPQGYGIEWRNLRDAVQASEIGSPFAIDQVADSPFANQGYLYDPFGAQETGMPDEELYRAAIPVDVNWGKLLDGVIVYP